MQVEKNQDMAIVRIKGNVQQRERELQEHLDELIVNGKSKIILDISEAELDMSYRERFKGIVTTANRRAQQQKGVIVFLASLGKKINVRLSDSLDLEKFYMQEQAMRFIQEFCE